MLGLVGAGLASCGPVRSPRVSLAGKGAAQLTATSARVDAVPGKMLVLPVRLEGPLPGSTVPRLSLADGRELEAALVWIGVEPDEPGMAGWLPATERWVVTPVTDGAIPASIGAWHVVAALPPDAAGQAIRLDERVVPVNWLADPDSLRPGSVGMDQPWDPWRTSGNTPEPDAVLLAPEWRSPLRQWRARLATTGLGVPSPPRGSWQVRGDPGVLDGLADLLEARWRVGLARLWYAEAQTCARLIASLTRTVEFAPGLHAPAWPVEQPMLDSLLAGLLDPARSGESLASRVRAWLETLPPAAAWVADDAAGLVGASAEPLAQLRAACLTDETQLLWAAGNEGLRVGEPQAVEPGRVGEVIVAAGLGLPMTGASGFTIRCGGRTVSLVARLPADIRPPGATCSPLMHDWTLQAWAASQPGAAAVPPAEWAAGALVFRDESGASPSGWSVFIECAAPVEAGDQLTLWFGQRGASATVLELSRDGVLRNDRHPEDDARLRVADQPDRWSVSVPIPREALEPGGVLRLGITRRDGRGLRTAWPRRMMPWEHEPSRAVVNLKTWSGLRES